MHSSVLLMFPLKEENKFWLFSMANKREYEVEADFDELQKWHIVGSSHGWLLFLNKNSDTFLHNPFSGTNFRLPGKETLYEFEEEASVFIFKAILSNANSRVIIIMYNVLCRTKLACCRLGDSGWTGFGGEIQSYCDIVCKDDMLYALGSEVPSIEVWDLQESTPTRKMVIQASCPQAHQIFPSHLYSSKWYLIFASGEMFLVVRYIGEFVMDDGQVISEGDTLVDYASYPLVCPYSTVHFQVYKLDFDQKTWLPVESLNDYALFLGANHSAALQAKEHAGCKLNAIYFTDDYWERMDEDYSYGGHDMGIFKLGDGSVEPIFDCPQHKIEPHPYWIVPN